NHNPCPPLATVAALAHGRSTLRASVVPIGSISTSIAPSGLASVGGRSYEQATAPASGCPYGLATGGSIALAGGCTYAWLPL
ncbi:hypothetical protein BHM03_00059614, partial [Ensete ventricosum]